MILSAIVAMANNNVIGSKLAMPWHMPADLAWFKKNTLGKPVIMGRTTFESIGRPLHGRLNIVLSRQPIKYEGIVVVHSVEEAIALVKEKDEVMVIGGGHVYEQFLPLVTRIYVTYIDAEIEGDTCFPDFNKNEWCNIFQETHQADTKNPYSYRFEVMEKK